MSRRVTKRVTGTRIDSRRHETKYKATVRERRVRWKSVCGQLTGHPPLLNKQSSLARRDSERDEPVQLAVSCLHRIISVRFSVTVKIPVTSTMSLRSAFLKVYQPITVIAVMIVFMIIVLLIKPGNGESAEFSLPSARSHCLLWLIRN